LEPVMDHEIFRIIVKTGLASSCILVFWVGRALFVKFTKWANDFMVY
jgi:hypothetical protein